MDVATHRCFIAHCTAPARNFCGDVGAYNANVYGVLCQYPLIT